MANLVSAEQLETAVIAAKNYTQNEIAKGGISAATFTLDTVPSTVEGAMWLDNSANEKLVIYHNNQHYYFPLAVLPKILSVNVAPSSVAVMQGQSATATVTALANDAVAGLSYGLSGAPTWITISDDLILIQPSDNDLGFANVQVIAQDTGSDAMSSAILRAEAKLRPIIESLSVIPPAVTVQQRQSTVATVSAVANEAVTGLSYSIDGAPSWVTLSDDSIVVAPTDNDSGNAVMTVFAYDNNSSASAATTFNATAALRPIISSVSVNPSTIAAVLGESTEATISAVANEAVTGLSYSLDGAPSWMNLSGNVIVMTPADTDSGSATVTVIARDTGSTAQAATVFNAEITRVPRISNVTVSQSPLYMVTNSSIPAVATITASANDLVQSVAYSLTSPWDNINDMWIEDNKVYYQPTGSGSLQQGYNIIAYDTGSDAKASISATTYKQNFYMKNLYFCAWGYGAVRYTAKVGVPQKWYSSPEYSDGYGKSWMHQYLDYKISADPNYVTISSDSQYCYFEGCFPAAGDYTVGVTVTGPWKNFAKSETFTIKVS